MLMKYLKCRAIALMLMCGNLLYVTSNDAGQRSRGRNQNRGTTQISQASREDIKQVERALGFVRKNPSSITWRNEATRYISNIRTADPVLAANYQRQYDAIVANVTVESSEQRIAKQLDVELGMLKRNPNNSMWRDRAKGNIAALIREGSSLVTNYQGQYNAIMGITVQVSEEDIKQVERALNLLKNNPSSTTWRNEAIRYINIIGKTDGARAANYQNQYDAIIGGVALESAAKEITKQLDIELGMLKRSPQNSMWQNKVKANIDALMKEDSALAAAYQSKYDAIIGM